MENWLTITKKLLDQQNNIIDNITTKRNLYKEFIWYLLCLSYVFTHDDIIPVFLCVGSEDSYCVFMVVQNKLLHMGQDGENLQ